MEIKNCNKCGKIYSYIVGPNLCPACKQEVEETFQEVKQYLYEHPGLSVVEVAKATGVSSNQIRQWVREERLQLMQSTLDDITCELCKTPITSGRYCPQCKATIRNRLDSAYPGRTNDDNTKKGSKMRFL